MNRTRPKQIVIRASEKEFENIKNKVTRSKLNQNEYLLKCCLNKKITVIDGIQDMVLELKRLGNEIKGVEKVIDCKDNDNSIEEIKRINEEMKEVWQLLRQLIQKTR